MPFEYGILIQPSANSMSLTVKWDILRDSSTVLRSMQVTATLIVGPGQEIF